MLQHLGQIEGRKKACKLFYFLDFDYYEMYEKPFTGETYIAFQMGPVPKNFVQIAEEMERDGLISTYEKKWLPTHDNPTIFYKSETSVDYPFTEQERKMLDRVIRKSFNGRFFWGVQGAKPPCWGLGCPRTPTKG